VEKRIPNFNTLSTLIDRLSIENVKLAYFENAVEHDNLTAEARADCQRKIQLQHQTIEMLKKELTRLLKEVFVAGTYEYVGEERTFK
jgi:hypothetical protein